jgi:hypothetical protein
MSTNLVATLKSSGTARGGWTHFCRVAHRETLITLEIVNSTIANNTAVNASGIRTFAQTNAPATTTLRDTIVASNFAINLAISTGVGGSATFVSQGLILLSTDADFRHAARFCNLRLWKSP